MGIFVQNTGFKKRTLQEIKATFVTGFRALFGPLVDTAEEGPTGRLISLPAKALADNWDGAQEVYSSYDPSMATGAALDRVCALTGIYRIDEAASWVKALLYTDADNVGVIIPSGRQARRVRGAVVFSLSSATTISPSSCQDIYLKFDGDPDAGDVLSVTTTFGTFTATVPLSLDPVAQKRAALTVLADSINLSIWANAGNNAVSGLAQVCSDGVVLHPASTLGGVQVQDLSLRIAHTTTPFGVAGFQGLAIAGVGSQGVFVCTVMGPNDVFPGELTAIVTPETGWVGVYNLVDGVSGRNVETDEELRLRRSASFGLGLATDTAIKNALYNRVPGIVSASVVSNRTLEVDIAGRPPKSFECTVQGGDDQAIRNAIWYAMPAGIESYGFTVGDVTDSEGSIQIVKFTRPLPLTVFVRIRYSLYSEESFPTDGELTMRAAIINWASKEYIVGKDVFTGRIMGVVYTSVSGVGTTVVEVSLDGTNWLDHLDVDGRHYAYLIDANLTVERVV